jgi:hypothetical protein
LSVGSNVLLKYGLYVVCHLSKWFTFSSLFNGHFLLCRVVIRLQLTDGGFARLRGGGISTIPCNLANPVFYDVAVRRGVECRM